MQLIDEAELVEMNALDPTGELAKQVAAQRLEYGTYVSNTRIYAGNALAYGIGHQVPISNVVKHGYWFNGQVDLVDGMDHAPEIAATIADREPVRDVGVLHVIDPGIADEDGDK